MSAPAIWPPRSSEQIFEAGIRTRCHAYLNEGADSSHQNSETWAGGGGCARARGGHGGGEGRPCRGGQLEPTYTFMAENTG